MKKAFPPIATAKSTVLILGSMPGEASLAAGQYYALSRNAFWPIMGKLFKADPALPYDQRVRSLLNAGIAVWDVLAACERQGSLDSAINQATLIANNFEGFLKQYPGIKHIFFNGKSVEKLFDKHVRKQQVISPSIQFAVLPSTSPANARMSFDNKLKAWRVIAG